MKTKIVVWGTNEKEEKVLIAIELLETEGITRIHTIPESEATEEFYTKMMNIWREGQDLPFPENHQVLDRPLSITDSLLPDDLKTLRTDILNRAKTEWHFVVLSSKLYSMYHDEIEDIKERVEKLTSYDNGIWEEMKTFWEKVQAQTNEKNLFREHANELRNKTNALFDSLKGMKKSMDNEFDRISKENLKGFFEKLDDIEDRIEKGLGLQPIFNELKDLQKAFKNVEFNRRDQNSLWKRIDNAFKTVKNKKYGDNKGGNTENDALTRVTRRYEGLLGVIGQMEASIKRDKKDEDFQKQRIDNTDGQLELQIRQAKMAMIQERVGSKVKKLEEMLSTKADLERKIESEKQKLAKQKEKEELNKVKETVKEEIAEKMKSEAESRKEEDAKLEKAAKAIKERSSKKVTKAEEPVAPVVTTPSDSEDHIPLKKTPKNDSEE
jgi:hypothetical protein